MDITESYDEYILRRSEGKPVVHWASLIGKTIADRYDEESFLVVNLDSSATESYLFKKDSRDSSIRVSKRLNGIAFLGDDADLDELLNDKQIQSWWKSVFFEADGFIEYDPYYDSFRVASTSFSDVSYHAVSAKTKVFDEISGVDALIHDLFVKLKIDWD